MFSQWQIFDELLTLNNNNNNNTNNKEKSARIIQKCVKQYFGKNNKMKCNYSSHSETETSSSSEEESEHSEYNPESDTENETENETENVYETKMLLCDDGEPVFADNALVCVVQNNKLKSKRNITQYMNIHHVKQSSGKYVILNNNDTYRMARVIQNNSENTKVKGYKLNLNTGEEETESVFMVTLPYIPGEKERHTINIGTQVCVTYDDNYRRCNPKQQYMYIGMVENMIVDENGIYIYHIKFNNKTFTYSNEVYRSSLERNLFVEEDNWVVHIVPIQFNEYTNEIKYTEKPLTYTFIELYNHLFFPLCVLFTTVILPKLLD